MVRGVVVGQLGLGLPRPPLSLGTLGVIELLFQETMLGPSIHNAMMFMHIHIYIHIEVHMYII